MKPPSPLQVLSDQLVQLHCMETHIARELLILAGSALNASLRRWLSRRAMAARARRDRLQDLVELHAHPFATRPPDPIRSILAEGNRDLALIRHPFTRDVAVIEHCIRIEQHAITAYGVAVPLSHRNGFPRISDKLKPLLGDLETARLSFKTLEAEVFSIAACHPLACVEHPTPTSRNAEKPAVLQPLAAGY